MPKRNNHRIHISVTYVKYGSLWKIARILLVSALATKNPSSKRPYAYHAEGVTGVDLVSDDQR